MTDGELLARYAGEGSPECFAELVRRHTDAVYGCCLRVLGNRHDAEDAVQATFLLLVRKARSLPRDVSLGGWLFWAASHCAKTSKRSLARQGRHDREASMQRVPSEAPQEPVLAEELRPHLDMALAELPAAERDAAVLRFFYGKTEEEIGQEVGCARRTVSMRLANALDKLRRNLSRRGVALSAASLTAALGPGLAVQAPAGLAASVQAVCLGQAAVSATVLSLTKGAVKAMFWMKIKLAAAVVGTVLAVGGGGTLALKLAAGEPALPVASGPAMTVLNNDSYLRVHMTFKTPVAITADGQLKTPPDPGSKEGKPLAEFQTAAPPADWAKPEFDDSGWERQRAPFEFCRGYYQGVTAERYMGPANSLICLRSRFLVDDPARVSELRLSLEYVGGAVVYVNGQELKRANLPEGKIEPDTLAEKYPDDLYCEPGGFYLDCLYRPTGQQFKPEDYGKPEFARRYRSLSNLPVPSKLLRKGTNVLAVEIHRAPINAAAIAAKHQYFSGSPWFPGMWPYAGLKSLSLTAAEGSALTPSVARPKGIQVWNCRPFDAVTVLDYGEAEASPRPVTVFAARNGTFSGRLVVSSDQTIKGLKIAVTDLARVGGDGKIPASAVRVRYAAPPPTVKIYPNWQVVSPDRFDALLDTIPAEIPVGKASPSSERAFAYNGRGGFERAGIGPEVVRKNLTSGALAPLWLTVRVPRDAEPGRYEGTVTLEAEGLKPTAVPLRVEACAWAMPDPKDFRMRNLVFLSEDSLALRYNVPRWSEKHFELMGKSLALMAEANSRLANVNLSINFFGGNKGGVDSSNAESMVRWVKQPDGSFKYDFTVFDKYLDLVAKTIGKPLPLRLNCWGEWINQDKDPTKPMEWRGPKAVTLLDPATGKLDALDIPHADKPEFLPFWKPVLDEARKKIEARGWFDVTSVGHNSYSFGPHPLVVDAYKKIWPDGAWSSTAHNSGIGDIKGTGVAAPCRYAESLWTAPGNRLGRYRELLAPRQGIWCRSPRELLRTYCPLFNAADSLESAMAEGFDGLGDFGADLFPVPGDGGRHYTLGSGRGTGGPGSGTVALLAPGPDGPVASERYETFREGVELCEALIFLERALQDKKIGGELAQRVNRYLDERSGAQRLGWTWWYGRVQRDAQLLVLAGEVAAAAGGGK